MPPRNGYVGLRVFFWIMTTLILALLAWGGTVELEFRHLGEVSSDHRASIAAIEALSDATQKQLERIDNKLDRLLEREHDTR